MPPALHPRSSMTLSLFTGTLAVSFLVVGLPHLVPCPVPAQAFADDGTMKRRRRRRNNMSDEELEKYGEDIDTVWREEYNKERMCPVPKPIEILGKAMGFGPKENLDKPVIKIEELSKMRRRIADEQGDGKG